MIETPMSDPIPTEEDVEGVPPGPEDGDFETDDDAGADDADPELDTEI